MNKSVIYIVGATVLVGGAYLFLKNKKAKDLSKLAEMGGATTGGTTSSLSNTSDGVSPSDANLNLTNANALMGKITNLRTIATRKCGYNQGTCIREKNDAIIELPKVISQLSSLGYRYDKGLLVKI